MKPKVLSLFCGAGGFDLGFVQGGFEIVLGIDNNKKAAQTYSSNFSHPVLCKDIAEVKIEELPDCDVVIGGFPCQGFSLANSFRSCDDPRNSLYKEYLRVIQGKKPKVFVAENVKGLLSMKTPSGERVIDVIQKDFSTIGYYTSYISVNAKNYDVPQSRSRVFIFGVQKELYDRSQYKSKSSKCSKPTRLKIQGEYKTYKKIFTVTEEMLKDFYPVFGLEHAVQHEHRITQRQALKDIPFVESEVNTQYKPHGRFMTRDRCSSWDGVSFTITSKTHNLHPSSTKMRYVEKDKYVFVDDPPVYRAYTWREAAALQTFPKDFVFCGGRTNIYEQVGNAVPVNLAWYISKVTQKLLTKLGK